jgi:hypothetical protein
MTAYEYGGNNLPRSFLRKTARAQLKVEFGYDNRKRVTEIKTKRDFFRISYFDNGDFKKIDSNLGAIAFEKSRVKRGIASIESRRNKILSQFQPTASDKLGLDAGIDIHMKVLELVRPLENLKRFNRGIY